MSVDKGTVKKTANQIEKKCRWKVWERSCWDHNYMHMCVYTHSKQKWIWKYSYFRISINVADCKQRKGSKKWKWKHHKEKYMNILTKKQKNHLEMKLVTLIITSSHSEGHRRKNSELTWLNEPFHPRPTWLKKNPQLNVLISCLVLEHSCLNILSCQLCDTYTFCYISADKKIKSYWD